MSRLLFCIVVAGLLVATASGAYAQQADSVAPAGGSPVACQTAVLANGFTFEYARRETDGVITRLYVCAEGASGYVEIPSEEIARFIQPEAPVPAAQPTVVAQASAGGTAPAVDTFQKASPSLPPQISPTLVAASQAQCSAVGVPFREQEPAAHSKRELTVAAITPKAVSFYGARRRRRGMSPAVASPDAAVVASATTTESTMAYLRQVLDGCENDLSAALTSASTLADQVGDRVSWAALRDGAGNFWTELNGNVDSFASWLRFKVNA